MFDFFSENNSQSFGQPQPPSLADMVRRMKDRRSQHNLGDGYILYIFDTDDPDQPLKQDLYGWAEYGISLYLNGILARTSVLRLDVNTPKNEHVPLIINTVSNLIHEHKYTPFVFPPQ